MDSTVANLEELLKSLRIQVGERGIINTRTCIHHYGTYPESLFKPSEVVVQMEGKYHPELVVLLQQRILPTTWGTEGYVDILVYDLETKKQVGKLVTQYMFSGNSANRYDQCWNQIDNIEEINDRERNGIRVYVSRDDKSSNHIIWLS